jgi:hypothetical protein
MHISRIFLFVAAAAISGAATPIQTATAVKVDNPRTVVVGERSVIDVYVSQFQDTLVVLPPSEKVRQTFVGDSLNWMLTTGKSDEPTRYISIKVKEPLVKQTTVNVLSDHDKSYTFRLIMSDEHCDSKVFVDPDSQLSQDLEKPPDRLAVMPRNSPETLLIREAKFHKSRIVPLHPTTAEQLRVYAGHRELMGYGLQTTAFFVSSHGGRLTYQTLRKRFRTLLDKAGVRPRERCTKPTIHSLRHTFVASRLPCWHEEGVDVERRLVHLATYLGHVDVRETYWYMTVTPELLSAATTDFRAPRLAGGEQ